MMYFWTHVFTKHNCNMLKIMRLIILLNVLKLSLVVLEVKMTSNYVVEINITCTHYNDGEWSALEWNVEYPTNVLFSIVINVYQVNLS